MKKEITFPVGSEMVPVQISVLEDFVECTHDMKSPFKLGEQVMPAAFDSNEYEKVIIKCDIESQYRMNRLFLSQQVSGESVCYEVADIFIKQQYPERNFVRTKTLFCNHYELQF